MLGLFCGLLPTSTIPTTMDSQYTCDRRTLPHLRRRRIPRRRTTPLYGPGPLGRPWGTTTPEGPSPCHWGHPGHPALRHHCLVPAARHGPASYLLTNPTRRLSLAQLGAHQIREHLTKYRAGMRNGAPGTAVPMCLVALSPRQGWDPHRAKIMSSQMEVHLHLMRHYGTP